MEILVIGELKKGNLVITHRINGELVGGGELEFLVDVSADIYDELRGTTSIVSTTYIQSGSRFFDFIEKLDKEKYSRIL